MIELGKYNTLTVLRDTRVGLFLGSNTEAEVLLPTKYVPQDFEIGDTLEVFCYLDHEERPVATTLQPAVTRDNFGALKVLEVNEYGAFMDWGLEKNLLVPYREQPVQMKAGEVHVVYCYLDPKSSRLVGSARLDRFLDNTSISVTAGQQVSLLVFKETPLGYGVVVENRHTGLLFRDQVHQKIRPGDTLTGYVKAIRPDQKLDIVLEPIGFRKLEPAAQRIYEALEAAGGKLALHDKSDPREIQDALKMSKKVFKKGIGILYRERKIEIQPDGICLPGQKISD
ncbi:CvfB family protein [Robiginitalea aurantiaca]|uniref:S1-like domain-containing RNA-binding protein n=1 Tax=Robiginitalea aurantiaca TaxID=3056915 RepID=A0ABT7WG52_9FLAO|nr:S1-like domain-containing RNA-binding protein [Robiginitalea aurantiaca]MDM9631897.1 S1-like domain-containing RNA-binding protein [Robiginitalea aurantiaca]